MNAWMIVLCFLFEIKGDLTLLDHKKALCIFNTIRQEHFHCFPSKDASYTQLKWNSTLEYYASVYARQMCVADLNIPIDLDLMEYKNLTSVWSRLDIFDHFYRELWNTRNYYLNSDKTLLDEDFFALLE
ncbi:hypothetical protein EG68_08792 [Paragonimus skrjabini miyazakii]|uniref:Uncharacterized protein n=1 Tax=Paragonimus skrjabini miyazakii TaxID=59628 RepID=A0A8S9YLI2_9TREM|nr:hypothetical protein EG68_08792 [Paragonimus skrjabini miyazakii]